MVVVAGVAIFMSSTLFAAAAHLEYQDELAFRERADSFKSAFRGYGPLLADSETGVFSKEKLDAFNGSRLYTDFDPQVMRFRYDVAIEEVACAPGTCGLWQFGKSAPLANSDILVMRSPVALSWHDQIRPAILVIRVWEAKA